MGLEKSVWLCWLRVFVDGAAEDLPALDLRVGWRVAGRRWVRGSVGEGAMRPMSVVVGGVLGQAIDTVGDAFGLTIGVRRLLLAARTGHGLLIAGTHRTSFESISSDQEHHLATTDPGFHKSDDLDGLS